MLSTSPRPNPPRARITALGLTASFAAYLVSTVVPAQQPTPQHWSFQPIQTSKPTTGAPTDLAQTLDAFIAKRRTSRKLAGSPPADRRTLIRRVYLDVHGLPPTLAQVDQFLSDKTPGAYQRLVDRVLASPRYGERWAQHWLDIVRYADTHGFEVNTPRTNAWPYRDWVIRSLNDDLPYNEFVFEQIAGNGAGSKPSRDKVAATGFLVAGPALLQGQIGKDEPSRRQARQDQLDEIIKATGSTFLGLTIGCARCHDHKFDPVTQVDYYAMQAVFAGVRYDQRPIPSRDDGRQAAIVKAHIESLQQELGEFEPEAFDGRTIQIDDTDQQARTLLTKVSGQATNPRGKHSFWNDAAGRDLIAYHPKSAGRFRIWVSWGAGSSHTSTAQYLLDLDGKPATRNDQRRLGTVDQRSFKGLHDLGEHPLLASSIIILRGGESGTTTADALVLQSTTLPSAAARHPQRPRLRDRVDALRNVDRFAPTRARFLRFKAFATNTGHEPCIDELEVYSVATASTPASNVALASSGARATSSGTYPNSSKHRLPHVQDGRYGNDRSWISNEKGRGWVQIEFAEPKVIDRVVWGRDRNRRYKDRLATSYEIAVASEPGNWQVVATSADRSSYSSASSAAGSPVLRLKKQLRAAEASYAKLTKQTLVFAGGFTVKPKPTHRLHRGNPMAGRELVHPATPSVFTGPRIPIQTEHGRRAAFADWVTSVDNPLTSRVIVNRIWQHHFGTGLIETPSDFGKAGQPPSHPELLDWLARVLMAGEWSLKRVHRVILCSSTYQQDSRPRPDGLRADGNNRLLWRFMPRRLEAEAIRDSILASSGALDLRMGGPGFSLFVPNTNYVRVYEPKTRWSAETFRRMVYAHKVRMEQGGVFGAFDCPDAGQMAPKRGRSTTALQSLNLFNSTFVLQQAEILARRIDVTRRRGDDRVRQAFRWVLGRLPNDTELRSSRDLVATHGLTALCRVLFNTNEFLVLP